MRGLASRSSLVAAVTLAGLVGSSALGPSVSAAGIRPAATVTWTRISSNTGLGIASAGLLRTSDGRLHVVWASNDHANGFSLHYSTLGAHAKLVSTAGIAAISKWTAVTTYPRLVPGPNGGIRLVFTGANGVGGSPFNNDSMYSATSGAAGAKWALTPGSMSQSKLVPLTDDAAVTQANGTPVAGWSAGAAFAYHVGLDPASPASAKDRFVSTGTGSDVVGPTMARDKSGSVFAAWFNASGQASQGYWVARLLPTPAPKVKAPGSGGQNLAENEPFQSVALAARVGGGEYLAYCVPTKTIECAHINLWKVGSASARTVPKSATGHASHVAIAAGPSGHLWILWYDSGLNKIRVVRTNSAANGFGTVRTIAAPPNVFQFDGLQAQGSQGPLDVIALALQGSFTGYSATELQP